MSLSKTISADSMFFGYNISTKSNDKYDLHCHSYYEVYCVIKGDINYLVEGKHYSPTPYSILLIPPNVFHGVKIESSEPYIRYTLHFLPSFIPTDHRFNLLAPFLNFDKKDKQIIYLENIKDYRIDSYFENLIDSYNMCDDLQEMMFPLLVQSLLGQIAHMVQSTVPIKESDTISDSITSVLSYINDNITTHITLDDLSTHFYISKNHLNRLFRKATGTTIGDYISYKRVVYAQQLLMEGYSASYASTNSGFRDYSAFYRAYTKVLNHSPLIDRRILPKLPVTNG